MINKNNCVLNYLKRRAALFAAAVVILAAGFAGCLDTVVKAPGKAVYRIDDFKCRLCLLCIPVCPVDIIKQFYIGEGQNQYFIVVIDTDKCIGCGNCAQACVYGALIKEYE